MNTEKQILGLIKLSDFLNNFLKNTPENYSELENEFALLLRKSEIENPWFTQENQKFALQQWNKLLTKENLENWVRSLCKGGVLNDVNEQGVLPKPVDGRPGKVYHRNPLFVLPRHKGL